MKSYEFIYEVMGAFHSKIAKSWCVLDTSLPKAVYKFIDYLDNLNVKIYRIIEINVNGQSYLMDNSYVKKIFCKAFIKWARENR